jgi:transcription elongation factor SPT4
MTDDARRIPRDLRNLRACLVCSLIKNVAMFEDDGCDNCEEYLPMKGNRERVYECTSSNFEGMIALMHPEESWVAKWQRIARHVKGMYAVSVTGTLSKRLQRELASNDRIYRSRDVSLKT